MNRSNSFVSSLKWWPLQGHNSNNNNNNNNNNSSSNCHSSNSLHTLPHNKTSNFGSSVAVQKLRESKWFKRDEQRIFCAVVECGFIVEVRAAATAATTSLEHNNSFELPLRNGGSSNQKEEQEEEKQNELLRVVLLPQAQDENELPTSWFGIVLCKTAKDNKPKPETIEISSVKIRKTGTFKMIKMSLEDIWTNGYELRINNFADKEKPAHCEKDIRNQVSFARKAKQSLWNNNKHFVYWCRYGSRQQDVRKRQMSECVKWGSVGMNAGMLLVMNKQKSLSK